jgi:DUF4097 and DUF4098 domain-containing protein YvlB
MKAIIIGFMFVAFAVNAQALAYTEERELKLEADGVRTLQISCDAGDLFVEGRNQQEIQVKVKIEIDNISPEKARRFIEHHIELWLRKDGDDAYLKSEIESGFWKRKSARIDLSVYIPTQLNLTVKDGSGSIAVRSIEGDTHIEDGSGSIEVKNMSGDMMITDGSGEITIKAIQGTVSIKDGSGGITAEDISGSLTIRDGSGSIRVRGVDGNVTVYDGSGSIDIRDVEKDVTVGSDGSGSRTISDVRGRILERE